MVYPEDLKSSSSNGVKVRIFSCTLKENEMNKKFPVFPLFYDLEGQFITDKNGEIVLELRGYGNFLSKNNYDEIKVNELQDDLGKEIVDCLNSHMKDYIV